MANINYLICPPHKDARRHLLKSQTQLLLTKKAVLYEEYPHRISQYKAFRYSNDIQQFFHSFLFNLEPISEIERWKLVEVKHYYTQLEHCLTVYSQGFLTLSTLYYTFRLKYDWIYKHKIKFIPSISVAEVIKRLVIGLCGFTLTYNSKKWLTPWLLAIYYPDLLCDAQIGKGFEIGYWTQEFVQALR